MAALLYCRAGGSAIGLSATGAWAEPLPVMVVKPSMFHSVPKEPPENAKERPLVGKRAVLLITELIIKEVMRAVLDDHVRDATQNA
jgi:hypothetical protein